MPSHLGGAAAKFTGGLLLFPSYHSTWSRLLRYSSSSSLFLLPACGGSRSRRYHLHGSDVCGGAGLSVVTTSRRCKGDYGFNVFHNSNPQHGGSYARHERRMREDEVEDFLKSVKGWLPVWDTPAPSTTPRYYATTGGEKTSEETVSNLKSNTVNVENNNTNTNTSTTGSSHTHRTSVSDKNHENTNPTEGDDSPPTASMLTFGDEAIMKTFRFPEYKDAYLFMGRLWAFCYGSDKYPHVVWNHTEITVYLYSPSFKGLSKREARLAAFLNDQFNMFRKSAKQRERVWNGVVQRATVEEVVGEEVRRRLAEREAQRRRRVDEAVSGPRRWEDLLSATATSSSSSSSTTTA